MISLEFLKTVVDDTCCMVITDRKGNYLHANKKWVETMGIPFEETMVGSPVSAIVKDTQIEAALKEDRQISGYSTLETGDGHKRRAFSIYNPIHDERGEVIAGTIITIISDDTSGDVERLVKELNLYKQEIKKLRGARYCIDNIIGKSPAVVSLREVITHAAKSTSTVLIYGETGSGKELVASSIHDLSMRRDENFVEINCANIPRDLLESELFGYEGGAFTGANQKGKIGKFEQANKGTLFLDEINQLSYDHQPKLLRVIQEREFERVGGTKSIEADIRFIAATNMRLEDLVEKGTFRTDLFYRLNVLPVYVPPLRERKEDIPLIIDDIVRKLDGAIGIPVSPFPEEVKNKLAALDYNWPGNIRELQNVVEWAVNMANGEPIEWDVLYRYFSFRNEREENKSQRLDSLKNVEREILVRALRENRTKTAAAEALGISRTMLYKKIKKYGL